MEHFYTGRFINTLFRTKFEQRYDIQVFASMLKKPKEFSDMMSEVLNCGSTNKGVVAHFSKVRFKR